MRETLKETQLPYGWRWSNLKEISSVLYRYPTFYGMEHVDNGIPVIRGEHIKNNGSISHDWNDYWYVTEEVSKKFPKTVVKTDDLIMSVRGSIGKMGIIDALLSGAQVSPNCLRISINPEVSQPKYVYYYFVSTVGKNLLSGNVNSTTIATIKASSINTIPIPLPPLDEQQRIVARIEELFTQLDAGVAALEAVRKQVKRYRQAVLQAAVRGRLVIENSGIKPEKWQVVTLEKVAEHRLGKMLDKEKNSGEAHLYLRNANVRWFTFQLDDLLYIKVRNEELADISARQGDVLVCEGGEPGRAAVWESDMSIVIQKAIHRVRPNSALNPRFFTYCLAADASSGRLEKYFTGSTIKHFTGQALKAYLFPLPSIEEQKIIVSEVERRLSIADQMEKSIDQSFRKAARLRQAILQRAFTGQL